MARWSNVFWRNPPSGLPDPHQFSSTEDPVMLRDMVLTRNFGCRRPLHSTPHLWLAKSNSPAAKLRLRGIRSVVETVLVFLRLGESGIRYLDCQLGWMYSTK